MNQIKTGQFIAACRKEQGLTQAQLAEKIGVSDRAVSKWENGKALPDASNMLDVCEVLGISVNELLTGEHIDQDHYKEFAESQFLRIKEIEEEKNRSLTKMKNSIYWIGIGLAWAIFFVKDFFFDDMSRATAVALGILSTVVILATCMIEIRADRASGYYECQKCGKQYIPSKTTLFWFATFPTNDIRYMKCPHCKERTQHVKILSKD